MILGEDYTSFIGDAERDEATVTIDPRADPDVVGRALVETLPARRLLDKSWK